MLARLARKRGDEATAIGMYAAAHTEVLLLHPLFSLHIGHECGGTEGARAPFGRSVARNKQEAAT